MFPVIQFNGPGSALQGNSIARMGVGFADTSPNGSWIFQDDLTWLHGAHSFHFGYEYKRYFYNDRALSDAGDFTFSARQTDLPGPVDQHRQCVRQLPARARCTVATTAFRAIRRPSASRSTACTSWMTGRSRRG